MVALRRGEMYHCDGTIMETQVIVKNKYWGNKSMKVNTHSTFLCSEFQASTPTLYLPPHLPPKVN